MLRLKRLLLLCCLMSPAITFAAIPTLPTLTQTQFDNIFKEFSANFVFTSVSPASTLGEIWGVEAGLIAGETPVPDFHDLVQSAGGPSIPNIYHAGILLAASGPFGLGGEFAFIPTKKIADVSVGVVGFAGKWTLTNMFFTDLPLALAFRAHYNSAKFKYSQNISNASTSNISVASNLELDTKVWGMNLMASKKFFIIEPFMALGFVQGNDSFSIDSSASGIPASILPNAAQSETSSPTSLQFIAGAQLDIPIVHIAAEYSRAFGTNRYTGKFSFHF